MHNVLIVANSEESREAACLVAEELRSNGYGVELCNSNEESNIKGDKVLDASMSPSGYQGIIFMDDGGDATSAIKLAKKASKEGVVIGGFSSGCAVLGSAGVLKDEYVPSEIAEEYDGEGVSAPSARSGDVVTSLGSCPLGFAALMIDALGGKVKNIVTATNGLRKSAVIISEALSKMTLPTQLEAEDRLLDTGNTKDITIRASENADLHAALLEREMAREGMWLQPDGMMAVDVMGESRILPINEAIEIIKKIAIGMLEKESRCMEACPDNEIKRAHIGSIRAIHRLRLLVEYLRSSAPKVKVAGIYGTSISGPYANIDVPWEERVMECREGDDWLTDRDKAIEKQPRYNPEYERTSDNDEFGFHYRWEDDRRTPYLWSRRLTEGVYPMRSALSNNPKGN